MTFATTLQDESDVISIPARFDFRLARDFGSTVDHVFSRGTGQEIIVDFARTDYLDSSALGMLLVLRDRARSKGKAVILTSATGAVKKSLEIAHFKKLFLFRRPEAGQEQG